MIPETHAHGFQKIATYSLEAVLKWFTKFVIGAGMTLFSGEIGFAQSMLKVFLPKCE